MMKFCKKCSAETERYSSGECKGCRLARNAAYKKANPEKIIAASRAYAAANAEQIKARVAARYPVNKKKILAEQAAYYRANKDRVKARVAAYRKANPGKVAILQEAYRKANPQKLSGHKRKWAKAHREIGRIHVQNRRARKRVNGGVLSKDLASKLFVTQGGLCACPCRQLLGDDYHMDHKIPVSRGGPNIDSNIQLLRAICNLQKGSKTHEEFLKIRSQEQ
jgi:5-methylcytosine-specific restriction endonuclease McrA